MDILNVPASDQCRPDGTSTTERRLQTTLRQIEEQLSPSPHKPVYLHRVGGKHHGARRALLTHERRPRSKPTEEENTMTKTGVAEQSSKQTLDNNAIRPFQVNVPEAELTELRRRITATRFPEKETVADPSQGVQLAFIQALARYWATDYNWRRGEAELNSHPQFMNAVA